MPYSNTGFKDFPGPGKMTNFFKDFQGHLATLIHYCSKKYAISCKPVSFFNSILNNNSACG